MDIIDQETEIEMIDLTEPGGLPMFGLPSGGGGTYDDTEIRARLDALEGASVAWTDIADLPVSFPASSHRHPWSEIDGIPATFPPEDHGHQIGDVSGLVSALTDKANVADLWSDDERDKLAGIEAGATANATDADLRDRAQHTGTQPISTIANLQVALDSFLAKSAASSIGLTLIGAADSPAARTALGLGTLATKSSVSSSDLPANGVTNARMAPMATKTLKGNATGASANPTDMTVQQVKDMLAYALGDIPGLQGALDGKQPTTTFKTVNGQTITGTGDITISGGGGPTLVFHAHPKTNGTLTGTGWRAIPLTAVHDPRGYLSADSLTFKPTVNTIHHCVISMPRQATGCAGFRLNSSTTMATRPDIFSISFAWLPNLGLGEPYMQIYVNQTADMVMDTDIAFSRKLWSVMIFDTGIAA